MGFSFAHELIAKPQPVVMLRTLFGVVTEVTMAKAIYETAKTKDEWPGEAYEGTSVLAGAKSLTDFGTYKSYAWAQTVEDLIDYVSWHGPAVLGINWYEGMINPTEYGVIHPTGEVVGGHAILCRGYNKTRDAFYLHNSWGKSWGNYGGAWITTTDMRKLMYENGEVCMPLRKPYVAAVEEAQRQIAEAQ